MGPIIFHHTYDLFPSPYTQQWTIRHPVVLYWIFRHLRHFYAAELINFCGRFYAGSAWNVCRFNTGHPVAFAQSKHTYFFIVIKQRLLKGSPFEPFVCPNVDSGGRCARSWTQWQERVMRWRVRHSANRLRPLSYPLLCAVPYLRIWNIWTKNK